MFQPCLFFPQFLQDLHIWLAVFCSFYSTTLLSTLKSNRQEDFAHKRKANEIKFKKNREKKTQTQSSTTTQENDKPFPFTPSSLQPLSAQIPKGLPELHRKMKYFDHKNYQRD